MERPQWVALLRRVQGIIAARAHRGVNLKAKGPNILNDLLCGHRLSPWDQMEPTEVLSQLSKELAEEVRTLLAEVAFRDALIADLREDRGRIYICCSGWIAGAEPTFLRAFVSKEEAICYARSMQSPCWVIDQESSVIVWRSDEKGRA